ncbi:MAG TPA: SUMF1/EgtB/PvdO family nonheme iron enzyme [Planctomycetota bacterium]|nr:SUMF1/EgtB/PvdO family nonheme iron enzyme [Planctomycetota bacterium]
MTIEADVPPPPDPGLDAPPSIGGTAESVLAVVVVLLVVRLGLTLAVASVLDPWRHGYSATWLWVGQLTGNTNGALLGWIGGSVASISAAVLLTRGRSRKLRAGFAALGLISILLGVDLFATRPDWIGGKPATMAWSTLLELVAGVAFSVRFALRARAPRAHGRVVIGLAALAALLVGGPILAATWDEYRPQSFSPCRIQFIRVQKPGGPEPAAGAAVLTIDSETVVLGAERMEASEADLRRVRWSESPPSLSVRVGGRAAADLKRITDDHVYDRFVFLVNAVPVTIVQCNSRLPDGTFTLDWMWEPKRLQAAYLAMTGETVSLPSDLERDPLPPEPLPPGLVLRGGELSNEKDGSSLVWVPRGSYQVFSMFGGEPDRRRVKRGFFLGRTLVTTKQYREFCAATGQTVPAGNDDGNAPVVNVTHEDAESYCAWAGVSLPTSEQWLRAGAFGAGVVEMNRSMGEHLDDSVSPVGMPEPETHYIADKTSPMAWTTVKRAEHKRNANVGFRVCYAIR